MNSLEEEKKAIRISGEQIKILTRISNSIGRTADEVLSEEYENISPEFARGYLEAFARHGNDEDVLLVYFFEKIVAN